VQDEKHLATVRAKGPAACADCGLFCSGSMKNYQDHCATSKHKKRAALLRKLASASGPAAAAAREKLAPQLPTGLQRAASSSAEAQPPAAATPAVIPPLQLAASAAGGGGGDHAASSDGGSGGRRQQAPQAVAAEKPTDCGGRVMLNGVVVCLLCTWEGRSFSVYGHFTVCPFACCPVLPAYRHGRFGVLHRQFVKLDMDTLLQRSHSDRASIEVVLQ